MKHNLISLLKTASTKVSQAITPEYKAGRALWAFRNAFQVRISHYTQKDITLAVNHDLAKKGIKLNLDWGKAFSQPVYKVGYQLGWSKQTRDDVLAAVFTDILVGHNIDTGGMWSVGTFADQVETWLSEGKSDLDILKLTQHKVQREARKKVHLLRETGTSEVKVDTFETTTPRGEEYDKSRVFLDMLSLSPMQKGQAADWMGLVDNDPEIRLLLRKVDEYISRSSDDKIKLLWDVLKENPDFGSRREIAERDVTFRDESGYTQTLPLWQALRKKKPNDIWFEFDKLKDSLKNIQPHVAEALA